MITVNKAIVRGQLFVNVPVMFIMFGVMVIGIFLGSLNYIEAPYILLFVFLAPIVAWIYWSFAITKWRIWAFSNVDDVYKLKESAIADQLIWEDGSFFEKTEIRTKKQRFLIDEIEKRFKK